MKIALLHYSSPPVVGGVESVLAHHAILMTRAGHQVTIFTGRGESFDPRISMETLPLLGSRHPDVLSVKKELDQGRRTAAFDALRERIKSQLSAALNGFDVLFAHNVASLHKNLPLTAALFELYPGTDFPKLILWHHDLAWTTPRYENEMHPGYPWDCLRDRWEGAEHVVISELRRLEFSSLTGIPQEVLHVIPNGVDMDSFLKLEPKTIQLRDKLNLLQADPLMLLPVRLTTRKNIELALYILAALRKQMPHAMLLVTGPEGPHNPGNAAYKQTLLQLRDSLELRGAAHFLAEVTAEFLPDSVISDFYRLSDLLLFPSREEGFGIPMIEAAFSRMPVFCSDITVLQELGNGDVTYFSPDADPVSVAEQIAGRLNGEPTLRWARRAKQTYPWNSIYFDLIEPLIKERRRSDEQGNPKN